MADVEKKHPTDSLETALALVLKETGKFFRAAQCGDSRQIGLAKAAVSQAIPAANQIFHEALDDIETEIIRAKSVFERDLSSIRTKRAARERAAAGVLRAQTPNGVIKKNTPVGTPKKQDLAARHSDEDQPKQNPEDTSGINGTDDLTTKESTLVNGHDPSPKDASMASDTIKTEPFTIPRELPEDPEHPKGLAISIDQSLAPSTSVPPDLKPESNANPQPNDQPPEQPMSAGLQDAEFESMFDDTNLPDTTDDLSFGLNFSADDMNGPSGLLDASAFQNISLPNGDVSGLASTATANEDLSSLLPGLENYVNGSNDFSVASIPGMNDDFLNANGNGNAKIPMSTAAGDGASNAPAAMEPTAPIESSFEDMFGLDSYMNGTGDDELGGTGNMGEVGDFDEDWFKTDGI